MYLYLFTLYLLYFLQGVRIFVPGWKIINFFCPRLFITKDSKLAGIVIHYCKSGERGRERERERERVRERERKGDAEKKTNVFLLSQKMLHTKNCHNAFSNI
jgi:hypothetical protein